MWYASDTTVSASNPNYFADGSFFQASPTVPQGSRTLEVADNLDGSVKLSWPTLTVPVDSFNVYVNGVLNQQTFVNGLGTGFTCTVTGLQIASYSPSTAAAGSGNSLRPQNMPLVGVATPALKYDFKVVAVYQGMEIVATLDRNVTPRPDSVMLITPMKRLWPFPNSNG